MHQVATNPSTQPRSHTHGRTGPSIRVGRIRAQKLVAKPALGIVSPQQCLKVALAAAYVRPCNRAGGIVNSLPQCGRGLKGSSCTSMSGRISFTSGHSGFHVKCRASDGLRYASTHPQLIGAIVRNSVTNRCGVMRSRSFSTAMNRFVPPMARNKVLLMYSQPLEGVKFVLKCGSLSYHGPGIPCCSVQLSTGCPSSDATFRLRVRPEELRRPASLIALREAALEPHLLAR